MLSSKQNGSPNRKQNVAKDALKNIMSDQMSKIDMLRETGEDLEMALEALFPMYLGVAHHEEEDAFRLAYIAAPFSMIHPKKHISLLRQAEEPIQKDIARSGANFIGWVSIVAAGHFDSRKVNPDTLSEKDVTLDNMALVASICTLEGEEASFASSLDMKEHGFLSQDQTNGENISALVVWSLATNTYVNIGDVMSAFGIGGAECQ